MEKSKGFETSIRILPSRLPSPVSINASSECAPSVQLTPIPQRLRRPQTFHAWLSARIFKLTELPFHYSQSEIPSSLRDQVTQALKQLRLPPFLSQALRFSFLLSVFINSLRNGPLAHVHEVVCGILRGEPDHSIQPYCDAT